MILNVVDRRKRRYRWKRVTAIVEPTWHDNDAQDSDQAEETRAPPYDDRPEITLQDAITWAHELPYSVTLYLYDLGEGIRPASKEEIEKWIRLTSTRLFSRAGKVVLVIAERPDGVFLYDYREDGRVFDTWHRNVDDAKHQATHYFGDAVGAWKPVPADVSDLSTFAREIAREQS